MYKSIIRPFLFQISPERVHNLLFSGLKLYKHISPLRGAVKHENKGKFSIKLKEIPIKSRVGLAAGFDKGAESFDELADFGFGFIEVGTVTPNPQLGNPKPRMFRLVKDESIISRTGFNNPGVDVVLERIKMHPKRVYRLGVNINRDPSSTTSESIVNDFLLVFDKLYDAADYFTINWGSIDALDFEAVLKALVTSRKDKSFYKKIVIKLPADITEETLLNVIIIARKFEADGFIATGPTMDRSNLICLSKAESERIGAGGVSGKGIGDKSKKIVKFLGDNVKGEFLIIGAGGVMTVHDAIDMMNYGADLVQIYSAFIFEGPKIVHDMNKAISR